MGKALECPVCGKKIRGNSIDEVMKKSMEHGKEAGHPEMSDEQMKELKAKVRDE